ncbi:hypothetical protein AVEN_259130-1 [Araneus ventricosus]|uniref:Uncharacterized protein n=1 Tax=Araneus ventricosus TaxID=182803 RepID=A0A4Y2UPK2_ARAVE|nr:hypothetical protein AVEN_259130-1 [Araneus ventricosus]
MRAGTTAVPNTREDFTPRIHRSSSGLSPRSLKINIILGIAPFYIEARSQFLQFQIWTLRSKNYLDIFDPDILDEFRDIKIIYSISKNFGFEFKVADDFAVYTDGSRVGDIVRFLVCILNS